MKLASALRGLLPAAAGGWPTLVGGVAAVAGLLALGVGLQLHQHVTVAANTPQAALTKPTSAPVQLSKPANPGDSAAAWSTAPEADSHLDDLGTLFRLLADTGLALGNAEYATESATLVPVTVRTLTLHLAEDYPRFKLFVARLLERMPHVSVQEIQFDRKDSAAPKSQITVRLAMVYRQAPNRATAAQP